MSEASAPLYPVFLRLDGQRVVVVGGGRVAATKVPALLAAGARVTLVAPEIHPAVGDSPIEIVQRSFVPADLDGAAFVVAAATPEVNRTVAAECAERRLFVNAVDDVQSASAFLGGVVRRDGVTIAISTDGAAPALAGLLREAIEAVLPYDLVDWVATAKSVRAQWKAEGVPMKSRRPRLLAALNALYEQKRDES